MLHDLIGLIVRPRSFFARKIGEPPDYCLPALIVSTACLVYLVMDIVYPVSAEDIRIWAITIVLNVFSPFIDWVVISLVLFVFCRAFSGTGTFLSTFRNSGYGMLPFILIAVMELIVLPFLNTGIAEHSSSSFLPVFAVLLLLNAILVVWSGYLWMYAMEKTHAIAHGDAMAAAAIAGVFYVLWSMAGWVWLVVL